MRVGDTEDDESEAVYRSAGGRDVEEESLFIKQGVVLPAPVSSSNNDAHHLMHGRGNAGDY